MDKQTNITHVPVALWTSQHIVECEGCALLTTVFILVCTFCLDQRGLLFPKSNHGLFSYSHPIARVRIPPNIGTYNKMALYSVANDPWLKCVRWAWNDLDFNSYSDTIVTKPHQPFQANSIRRDDTASSNPFRNSRSQPNAGKRYPVANK